VLVERILGMVQFVSGNARTTRRTAASDLAP
jgi:hypothetical protein